MCILSDTLEDAECSRCHPRGTLFANSIGIADIFPIVTERHAYLQTQTELIEQQQRLLQTFTMGPVQWALPAQQALPLINHVAKAVEEGPPSIDELPDEIKYQLTTKSGKWITYAYGYQDQLNSTKLHNERLAAEAIQPTVAGVGNFIELAMDFNRPWVVPTISSVVFFVALVLLLDLRHFRWILLALTPVSFSVLITLVDVLVG